MTLTELYSLLNVNLVDGKLSLSIDSYENTFNSILNSLFENQILLLECQLRLLDDYIEINATTKLDYVYHGEPVHVVFLCYEDNENIYTKLNIKHQGICSMDSFFCGLSFSRVAKGSEFVYQSSILRNVELVYPELSTDSKQSGAKLPFTLTSGISFPSEGWGRYAYLVYRAQSVTGSVQLKAIGYMNKQAKFSLYVPIYEATEILKLKDAVLSVDLFSGYKDNYDPDGIYALSGATLNFTWSLDTIDTPIVFSMPLFQEEDIWEVSAGFEKGLSVSDVVNTVGKFIEVESLYLPPNTPLDFLKLYFMGLKYNRRDPNAHFVENYKMILASSKPWVLPLPFIRLERFSLNFETTKSKNKQSVYTLDIAGTLSFNLGKTMLLLNVEAIIPEMEFNGSLIWLENNLKTQNPPVTLTELLSPFQANAPNDKTGGTYLARLDVTAITSERSFSIRADINDIFEFSVGSFPIRLARVTVEGALSSTRRMASIYGVMAFGDTKDEHYFELDAKAKYDTGNWFFEGGLRLGVINVGDLLTKVFSIDSSSIVSTIFNIEVNELRVTFSSEGKSYTINAGIQGEWEVLDQQLKVKTRIRLEKLNGKTGLFAAAMFGLEVGLFTVIVQVNDFYCDSTSYLFRIQYDKLYLQAGYAVQLVDSKPKKILTVSMGGMTLGALVESLVNMINPNAHFKLEAPWSIINKIDLSQFQLVINTTDETAAFYYIVNLNIPGLMKIDKVGVQYKPDPASGNKKLYFALTGKLLTESFTDANPLSWDAIDERPPAASSLNQKTFELYYLGLGQHLDNVELKNSNSLNEALSALKRQLTPERLKEGLKYSDQNNWLFGAEFKIDALKVGIVLNDPTLYGLMVTVEPNTGVLSTFAGLYLELLYKKITESISMFKAILMLPDKFRTIQLGAVTIKLGLVSFEVYTNGSFYIDLGFPHNADFKNSFVLEVAIYTGRGGIYLGVLKGIPSQSVPNVSNGVFSTILQLGVGLSFGLGRSFDLGIAKGGLSLEVFGIFEGVLAFFECKDDNKQYNYYAVSATVGIMGRLYLTVDFSVITVSASAEIKAYAKLTMVAYKAMNVILDLSMKLKASVKILFVKVKFSYSFNKRVTFVIGQDSSAPWKLGEVNLREKNHLLRNLLKIGKNPAWRTDQVTQGIVYKINLSILPMFTVMNPSITLTANTELSERTTNASYGVAFIPLLDKNSQKEWMSMLTNWLFSIYDGDMIPYDLDFTPDIVNSLDYCTLYAFLNNNATFSLCKSNFENGEGAVFPVPPPLALRWYSDPSKAVEIKYWQDAMVSNSYAKLLTAYFKDLIPDPEYDKTKVLLTEHEGEGSVALAELVFMDYFKMALRALIGQVVSYFESFKTVYRGQSFSNLEWTQIIENNSELTLNPGEILMPEFNYTLKQNDTLALIASKYHLSYEKIIESIYNETMLLRQGSVFRAPEYSFDNSVKVLPLKLVAALFYVRYYEFEIQTGYQPYFEKIASLNPEISLTDETTMLESLAVRLPVKTNLASIDWNPLMGDTLVRMSKMCFIYELSSGENLKWDGFLASVKEQNNWIVVPSLSLKVDGDLTLPMLIRRIYPDKAEILWREDLLGSLLSADVFMASKTINLKDITVNISAPLNGDEMTVTAFMAQLGCTVSELARALALNEKAICNGQDVVLNHQVTLSKADVLAQILCLEDGGITEMLSRFLLQGLKVPDPWVEGKNLRKIHLDSVRTRSLLDCMRQQIPLTDVNSDWHLQVSSEQEGCKWIASDVYEDTFTLGEIQNELPALSASIALSRPVVLPNFIKTSRCYSVSTQLLVQTEISGVKSVINLLPANMVSSLGDLLLEPRCRTEKGEVVNATWSLCIEVGIKKRTGESQIYDLLGVSAQDRLLLEKWLDLTPANINILYKASPVSGADEVFINSDWNTTKCILAKRNLSVETHMKPSFVRDVNESSAYEYSADMTKNQYATFIRLFWECSVVGGGGYTLSLESNRQETLPDNIFDETLSGRIYLVLTTDAYVPKFTGINSSIFEARQSDFSHVTYFEAYDENRVDYQAAFPVGSVGLRLEMATPPKDDSNLTAEERTREQYHIISYQIEENLNYNSSHVSIPLVPQAENEDLVWHYEPVVVLGSFVKNDLDNPYSSIGKEALISFDLRDIVGNSAEISEFSTVVTPSYNDFIIPIHEWPYQEIFYEIKSLQTGPAIVISAVANMPSKVNEKSLKLLKLASAQVRASDTSFTASSSLLKREVTLDKGEIINYIEALIKYVSLADTAPVLEPPTLQLIVSLLDTNSGPLELPQGIVKLYTEISTWRIGFETEVEKARKVSSNIGPFKEGTEDFVSSAEAALPQLRLAQGSGSDKSLYFVTFGSGGTIESITISPYQYLNVENQSILAPEFYALRPLANHWMTRSCRLVGYDENGNLHMDGARSITTLYTNVDMEIWAIRLLEDFESVLETAAKWLFDERCKVAFDNLISKKSDLATVITLQLTPLREGAESCGPVLSSALEDRLKKSLVKGYNTDLVAKYQLSAISSEKCRLTLSEKVKNSDSVVQMGKIDARGGVSDYCVFIDAMTDTDASLSPDVSAVIQELEFDISEVKEKYESSKWLKFFNPVQNGSFASIKIDLTSQLAFPNVYKRCPMSPIITAHKCKVGEESTISDMLKWQYELECSYEGFEQDALLVNLELACEVKALKLEETMDLFDMLAEYDLLRDSIQKGIQSQDVEAFIKAINNFAELLRVLPNAWQAWVSRGRANLTVEVENKVYQCKITKDYNSSRLILESLNQTEAVLESIGVNIPSLVGKKDADGYQNIKMTLASIPLYQCHRITPYVQVIRNADIIKSCVVNDAFIYETEVISKQSLLASRNSLAMYSLGQGRLKSLSDYQRMVGELWESLEFGGVILTGSLSISYHYALLNQINTPYVSLPVTLYLNMTTEVISQNVLAMNLFNWFNEMSPVTSGAYFLFDLTLYAEDEIHTLLKLPLLKYQISQ